MCLTDIECEPRVGRAEEDLAVFPLGEVSNKVSTACARCLDTLGNYRVVILDILATGDNGVNVMCGLLDVALDIHSEPRGLGDGETEVKGDDTRNASKTNEETPSVVNGDNTRVGRREDGILVCSNNDDGNDRGGW